MWAQRPRTPPRYLTMYPSWGNYGAQQSHNFGGARPHRPPGGGQAPGFGSFEAPSGGSMFSSLQEQHRQQMQQLQMLHQKQLQSVLHHGNSTSAYGGGGQSGGYQGSTWHSDGAGRPDSGSGAQSYFKKDEPPTQPTRGPPAPQLGHSQPPPLPAQPHPNDPQPVLPPEPPTSKPPEHISAPKAQEANKKDPSTAEEDASLPLQVLYPILLWVVSCCIYLTHIMIGFRHVVGFSQQKTSQQMVSKSKNRWSYI